MRTKLSAAIVTVLAFASIVFAGRAAASDRQDNPASVTTSETYKGNIAGVGTQGNIFDGDLGDATVPFTLTITGSTSDADLQKDAQILKTDGQRALLDAISKNNLGTFTLQDKRYTVNMVQVEQLKTGRRISAVFGRWLQNVKVGYESMAKDYVFAYVELFVKNNGDSDGVMFTATRITLDGADQYAIKVPDVGNYPDLIQHVATGTQLGMNKPASQ